MRFSGHTDCGKVRQSNQDSFYCDPEGRFFIVADGMGGHAAGAQASILAVDTIRKTLADGWRSNPAPQLLNHSIEAANEAILHDQETHPERADMGTTIVVILLDTEGNCWSAHIGDSRLYRLRGKDIQQMTEDHTLIARAVRLGELTPAQSKLHPYRHILERCLGRPDSGPPAVQPIPLQLGDRLLLCSDGLTEELDDGQIAKTCQESSVLEEIPAALVTAANEKGGRDNVTVVMAEYLG
ncbi:PP2C family serine/threonine-protein phosphatase [Synechococcus sp. PCC 7336]|uniref:PP2C family protein-serine/threonine phosphatase n=1 Tax=Synechococcus sp. PCC 7336 TaxID=195250 RepID=UPI000346E40F|nr:protein phosphatase 2C domain-containing protein [Synechococcus sp. PCC 7336]